MSRKNNDDAFHREGISNPAYIEQRVFLGDSPRGLDLSFRGVLLQIIDLVARGDW